MSDSQNLCLRLCEGPVKQNALLQSLRCSFKELKRLCLKEKQHILKSDENEALNRRLKPNPTSNRGFASSLTIVYTWTQCSKMQSYGITVYCIFNQRYTYKKIVHIGLVWIWICSFTFLVFMVVLKINKISRFIVHSKHRKHSLLKLC